MSASASFSESITPSQNPEHQAIIEAIGSGTYFAQLREHLDPGFKAIGLSQDALLRALTHRSAWNEIEEGLVGDNFEYATLGKVFLSLFAVMSAYDELGPGASTNHIQLLGNQIVERTLYSDMGNSIGIESKDLIVGKGISGDVLDRAMNEAVAALIGATCVDVGIEAGYSLCNPGIRNKFGPLVSQLPSLANPKLTLHEILDSDKARPTRAAINYHVVSQSGTDHEPIFEVEVRYGGKTPGTGVGKSKKEAENNAAIDALKAAELSTAMEVWLDNQRNVLNQAKRHVNSNLSDPDRGRAVAEFLTTLDIDSNDALLIAAVNRALTLPSYVHEFKGGSLLSNSVFCMLGAHVIQAHLHFLLTQTQMIEVGDLKLAVQKLFETRESVFDDWKIEGILLAGKGIKEISSRMKGDVVNALAWSLFRFGNPKAQHRISDLIFSNIEGNIDPGSLKTPVQRVQESLQESGITDINYAMTQQTGSEHEPLFEVALIVDGKHISVGVQR